MNRSRFRVCCLQLNSGENWVENFGRILSLAEESFKRQPDLIALPENFAWRGKSRGLALIAGKVMPYLLRKFKELAKEHQTAFLLGGAPERSSRSNLYYNTAYLISKNGQIAAKYRKIHLFDIELKGKVVTQESRHTMPGLKVVSGKVDDVQVGMSICYDLRFPELYRALVRKRSQVLCVPANFTQATGQAHWEVLLRARAIENQAFILAPAQAGVHPGSGIPSFGHSLIVDPWGKILARGSTGRSEALFAELDLAFQARLRQSFPVLLHRRVAL